MFIWLSCHSLDANSYNAFQKLLVTTCELDKEVVPTTITTDAVAFHAIILDVTGHMKCIHMPSFNI